MLPPSAGWHLGAWFGFACVGSSIQHPSVGVAQSRCVMDTCAHPRCASPADQRTPLTVSNNCFNTNIDIVLPPLIIIAVDKVGEVRV